MATKRASDKPIRVRIRRCPDCFDCGYHFLGPVAMCRSASQWLRETFPKGGTFREAWERCPRGDWLRHMVVHLAPFGMNVSARLGDAESAAAVRAIISYEDIEKWLRRTMRGRPEVIE